MTDCEDDLSVSKIRWLTSVITHHHGISPLVHEPQSHVDECPPRRRCVYEELGVHIPIGGARMVRLNASLP